MNTNNPEYMVLNAFLSKEGLVYQNLEFFISGNDHTTHQLKLESGIPGTLFVKIPEEKPPSWRQFLETGLEKDLSHLQNKSSSAVLLIEVDERVMAYSFGYGRFLLEQDLFISDFGIKTALNTLKHDSLKSVDLFSIDRSPVQKKSQAVQNSSIDIFGIDVSRDILRAVTGSPRDGVNFKSISGGDAIYSFGTYLNFNDLVSISNDLIEFYKKEDYKVDFSWVDNIRRVKDSNKKDELDEALCIEVSMKNSSKLTVIAPEVVSWEKISGFSFTNTKDIKRPVLEIEAYFLGLNENTISILTLKNHKLFVFDLDGEYVQHSLYKCFYFEKNINEKTYILFCGDWYEVDNDFIKELDLSLGRIGISELEFPTVREWMEGSELKIEAEGDYNARTAKDYGYNLLDKKTIKSRTTTSAIELCDLLSDDKKFIHVKHKKGGSSGLSHLFSQGYVSAEVMLSDRQFRKEARKKLKAVKDGLEVHVPLDNFNSNLYEIIYLILGDGNHTVKSSLPFFSKINLAKSYNNLTQKGFKVKICGVVKEKYENIKL